MKAVVFVDRHYAGWIPAMAHHAKSLGYVPYWIGPRGQRAVHADQLAGIIETDRWDEASLRRHLAAIERHHDIAALTSREPSFTRESLLGAAVAELARERGLPAQNPAAYWRSVNKFLARDALRAAGVRTVDFDVVHDEEEAAAVAARIGFPLVLKPLTGAASHLIVRCRSEDDVRRRFATVLAKLQDGFHASHLTLYDLAHWHPDASGHLRRFEPASSLLAERYVRGREASVECIAVGDDVRALVVHDKVHLTERDATVLEDALVTPPVRFTGSEIEEIVAYAVAAARAVGLCNSFAHVELRYEVGIGPQLIEINPRLGGAYIAKSIAARTGLDPMAAQVDLALGRFSLSTAPQAEAAACCGFAFFSPRSGVLAAVEGVEAARAVRGVVSLTQEIPLGTAIGGDEEECFVVVGFATGATAAEALGSYDAAKALIRIEVQ